MKLVMASAPSLNDRLLELIKTKELLPEERFQDLRLKVLNTGRSVDELLNVENLLDEGQIVKLKAEASGFPFVDITSRAIGVDVLGLIPEAVAKRYQLIPFELRGEILKVAMVNPLNLQAIKFIEQKSGKRVEPYFGTPSAITAAISQQYAQSVTAEVSEAIREIEVVTPENITEKAALGTIREDPIPKIVARLLSYGMQSRASDIHIEPTETKTSVRYRIDGILHEKIVLPKKVHDGVISRIKILAGMKIDEKRIPQDGRFSFRAGENEVDLRVSSLPTVYGEKGVLRLLQKSLDVPSLPQLGLRGNALKILGESIHRPHGIILVTGPTGSGKTTTLYSVLHEIATPKVNVITLEDPVEYKMVGVNQVQINPAAGLTFASGLRSILRQDPDIIMVGEIRDVETTDLAIQAALTGHLVFSTVHTNSASGALPRLLDMNAEPYLLASSIACIVGQRVVRRVCKKCRQTYEPPQAVINQLKEVLGPLFPEEKGAFKLVKGKGCSNCNNTGYLGRIGIFEVLPASEKIGMLILERRPANLIEDQGRKEGMITMVQDGFLKVIEGITTIEEVLRVSED
jgi:type IV pilus assembly protein PilB